MQAWISKLFSKGEAISHNDAEQQAFRYSEKISSIREKLKKVRK